MTEMTPEKATALRRPFPPESVGQLPKGGVMLDYVGHAAVTDRLLTVDPHWTWEPFAVDSDGLPAPDGQGNLWIRLTVCGVTRIGVGDGKNAKERIGDAIRNAAMRFGVALDLWAKENLVEFAQAASGQQPAPVEPVEPPHKDKPAERLATTPEDDPYYDQAEKPILPMADKTRARMFALLSKHGITDEDAQRAGISRIVGREIASRGELSEGEAQAVIKSLNSRPVPDESEARSY